MLLKGSSGQIFHSKHSLRDVPFKLLLNLNSMRLAQFPPGAILFDAIDIPSDECRKTYIGNLRNIEITKSITKRNHQQDSCLKQQSQLTGFAQARTHNTYTNVILAGLSDRSGQFAAISVLKISQVNTETTRRNLR